MSQAMRTVRAEATVGKGGMSTVDCAFDMLLERNVALKFFDDEYGEDEETSSASGARRVRSRSSRTRTSSP